MKKLCLSFFMLFAVAFCYAGINITYKGLDNIHIQFDHQTSKQCTVKLVCGETILFSQVLPQGGGSVSANIHHTGLSNGTYTYNIFEDEDVVSSVSETINGQVCGTLLFDETINIPADVISINVPEGKTLDINADISEISFSSIDVVGNINLQNGITIQGVTIYFGGQPVAIRNIKLTGSGEFYFKEASSGSSIENCDVSSVSVDPNTSIAVKNSKIGTMLVVDSASLNAEESEISDLLCGGNIVLNRCSINGELFLINNAQNFTATDTCFLNRVNIEGGSPQFSRCEFLNQLRFYGRNQANFDNCVFGNSVSFVDFGVFDNPKWSDNSGMQPIFSHCSFVGQTGPYFEYTVPSLPVDLGGSNYYGDKKPDLDWFSTPIVHNELPNYPQGGRFLLRGVPVNKQHFRIEQWSTSGPNLTCNKILPDIWANDYIVGQNTIPWPNYQNTSRQKVLIKGRETLLSVDVATNYPLVQGVKFKAVFDGQEIAPVNPSIVLKRDISDSSNDVFYGNTTINFILPPTENDIVNFTVIMDTTNISGFDDAAGKAEKVLFGGTLSFAPSYARQLNILVQPVQLFITGYTRKIPDASSVASALKNLIPAMLPIDRKDLHIWTAPVTTFYGGIFSMFSTTALLNRIANELALGQGLVNTTASVGDWLSGRETAMIDFIVAVMPKGSMGEGVSGVSLALRRGIIFVDESAPDAALHEMGHGIGLYTGTEQYDQYPPAGLSLERMTAFLNDDRVSINGFRNRFLHFPGTIHSWYQEKYWYDIMGSSTTLIWPNWTTFSAFAYYFNETLGNENKTVKFLTKAVPSGNKRIFVSATTEKTNFNGGYKIKEGTISAFDITDFSTGKINVPVYWDDDNIAVNDYIIKCFDSADNQIFNQPFTVVSPYPGYFGWVNWPEESSWCGTFDIPENTHLIAIYPRPGWWNNFQDTPILEVNGVDYEPIKITGLEPGQQLGESVEIRWTQDTSKQSSSMRYLVMYSEDGGNSWLPAGIPVEGNKVVLPTDFLPASEDIIFKVIGSNGLGTVEDEVGGLKLENRAPKAVIVTPKEGWVGEVGTKWVFKGYGEDVEDGVIPQGQWSSSIDGEIDASKEVELSQGIHTITFTVTDSGGLTGSTSITVEVKQMQDIDIGLNEDSLQLFIEGKDPLNTSPVLYLKENGIHRAILKIQNTGTDTIFTGAIYITKPGEAEQLLTEKTFTAGAFEEVVISETFLVVAPGQYQIRGQIKDITPQDTEEGNNEEVWIYSTKPESPVILVAPEDLDFGDAKARKQGQILVSNYGKSSLRITSMLISGADANQFGVDDTMLQQDIPEGNNVFIPVYFNPVSTGTKQALLTITSNDINHSTIQIQLRGNCIGILGDISGDSSVDISDVILCLRQAIGLDEPEIDSADMNEDGVIDISDVILVLRKAIGL